MAAMEPYELIRSRRKTLALEITRDCRVVVRAPLRASRSQIDIFVRAHADWIAKHLEAQRRRAQLAHGDHVAEFHLARGLGIGAVHRHLVVAHGIGGIAAGLEDPHRPKVFIQTDFVHIVSRYRS